MWRESLLLGLSGAILIYFVRFIPYLGAFILALGILGLQGIAQNIVEGAAWSKNLSFFRKHSLSYIAAGLLLLPTFALAGSAIGLLQSRQNFLMMAPLASTLLFLGMYFYFIFTHSLRVHLEKGERFVKAIDIVGLCSIRNFKIYFLLSFYSGLFLLISIMTWGAALVVTLPLMFYANYFSFLELDQRGLIVRAPQ